MRRVLKVVIFVMCAFMLKGEKPVVVATASIFKDMAVRLAGDLVKAESLVPIGGDPHLYEATPSDALLVGKADLILVNGLTFEGWIDELIENSGTKAEVVLITKGIIPIKSSKYYGSADPHAWMDGQNGLVYIENIKDALISLLPGAKEQILNNYREYRNELIDLNDYIAEKIRKLPQDKRILITTHDAFTYYGRRYGLQLEAMMGISTESDSKTDDIIRVSEIIKRNKIPAVFVESTINPKLLQQIAFDNGAEIGGELFADSLGDSDSEAPTYLKMLRHNTDVIYNALSGVKIYETKIDADLNFGFTPYLAFGFVMILILIFLAYRLS